MSDELVEDIRFHGTCYGPCVLLHYMLKKKWVSSGMYSSVLPTTSGADTTVSSDRHRKRTGIYS